MEQVFQDLPVLLAQLVVQVKCVVHSCTQSLLKIVPLNSTFRGSVMNVDYPKAVTTSFLSCGIFEQEAELSQKDRAAGCVSFCPIWKNRTGRRYFAEIRGLSSITVT